jgi:hypothetical protein
MHTLHRTALRAMNIFYTKKHSFFTVSGFMQAIPSMEKIPFGPHEVFHIIGLLGHSATILLDSALMLGLTRWWY